MRVAAIFIDPEGPYPSLGLDCWTLERNALEYRGKYPVIAHPPCNLWTNLAFVNYKRYGGRHNKPGNDGGAFAFALETVRRCGGVLEHPAFSRAWKAYGLLPPAKKGWNRVAPREWVCEVWQSAYGHKARKRTWLFYSGKKPLEANWDRPQGTHQCGWFDRIKPTLGKKEASRTPLAFAKYLTALALTSG